MKINKYIFLFLFIILTPCLNAQYLCKNEYRVINKQKRAIKKKAQLIAKEWLSKNSDSLNIPIDFKLSKLKFKAEEIDRWREIDSLICVTVKRNPELIKRAKIRMVELELVVYDIRGSFNFADTKNPTIQSVLYFEYDFNGDLIRAIIRQKEMSPYSETPYRKKP